MTAEAWTCHARPALKGSTCGHVNSAGIVDRHHRIVCCEACGCTKAASDARAAKAARKAVQS